MKIHKCIIPKWLKSNFCRILIIILLLILIGISLMPVKEAHSEKEFLKSKYQAVFMTNGRVYFGHIEDQNPTDIVLKQVYYLNIDQELVPDPQDSSKQIAKQELKLVALTSELHAPEDLIIINRGIVGFIEELKPESPIARILDQALAKKTPEVLLAPQMINLPTN